MKKLTVSFKEGEEQSRVVTEYFYTVASSLVAENLQGLTEGQYLVSDEEKEDSPEVPVRIFQYQDDDSQEIYYLAQDIKMQTELLVGCETEQDIQDRLSELFKLTAENPLLTFMAEIYEDSDTAFMPEDGKAILSVYVSGGKVFFVSLHTTLLVYLEDGLYGMAISGKGSYSIRMAAA